jgi:transcription initiation factor TFIIIB Brf1 subunit/transcription initiation factor TFIIB
MIKSIYDVKECPDCASMELVYNEEREEIVCKDCGLIFAPLAPHLQEKFDVSHGYKPKKEKLIMKAKAPAKKKPKAAKKAKKKAKAKKAKKAVKKSAKPAKTSRKASGLSGFWKKIRKKSRF